MRKNEDIDFEIPLIISDHLREKTGKPVFPVGLGETPETSFIEISLSGLTYSNQLTRTADFIVWIYTPISEGLEQSFIEGDELRKALNSSVWGVKTLQSLQIENGNILTDSPYPSFYAQEIMFWATYVHKPLPVVEVEPPEEPEPPYEPEPVPPFMADMMAAEWADEIAYTSYLDWTIFLALKYEYHSPLGTEGIVWIDKPPKPHHIADEDFPFYGHAYVPKDVYIHAGYIDGDPRNDIEVHVYHPLGNTCYQITFDKNGRVAGYYTDNDPKCMLTMGGQG